MMKELRNLSILAIIGVLTACGAATDSSSGNDPISTDEEIPGIISISANIGSVQDVDLLIFTGDTAPPINIGTTSIVFGFDEALDPNSINQLNLTGFLTSSGKLLKGTWSYEDTSTEHLLTVTLDPTTLDTTYTALPSDETFAFNFRNTVTDLAGNGLVFQVNFHTPLTHDVVVNFKGLPIGESLEVTVIDQAKETPRPSLSKTFTSSSDSTVDQNVTFNTRYTDGTNFRLIISAQPNDDLFCAFTHANGVISGKNAGTEIKCSNVIPYNTYVEVDLGNYVAKDWNTYYPQTDDQGRPLSKPYIHSGEKRKFTLSNLTSCDNLVIEDKLGAFEWHCALNSNPIEGVTIYSSALKKGKYLSDLINFSATPPAWLENEVSVKISGVDPEQNQNKSLAVWWNNPVAIPTSDTLSDTETIYVIPSNSPELNRSYNIDGKRIALVVQPGTTLVANTNSVAALNVYNSTDIFSNIGIWIEGSINASNSTNGILVNYGLMTNIRNVSVSNASSHGISLRNSELSNIIDTNIINNDGNGLNISGQKQWFENLHGNLISNLLTDSNNGHGVYTDREAHYNTLSKVVASNNALDGIHLTQNTKIIEIETTNNQGNGLTLNGQNNTVSVLTSASNLMNGINFSNTSLINPVNNFVGHVTTAANGKSGVAFDGISDDTIIDTNNFLNIVSAYNTTNINCGTSTACDGIVELTEAVNAQTDTFYQPLTGETYKVWSLLDSDSVLFNKLPLPNDFTLTHTYNDSSGTTITYLENAFEPANDESGNNNGLCEINENCQFTPNLGSYQGHGDTQTIISVDNIWEPVGVTMVETMSNGITAP